MADPRYARLREIFHEVADVPDGQRDSEVARHCDGDEELEGLVFDMLRCDSGDSFLDAVPSTFVQEAVLETDEPLQPGDRVGVWKIEERLAAGGMGVVYRAA